MKKILSILFIFVLCFHLSACKNETHIVDIGPVHNHTEDSVFFSRQQTI